MRNDNDRRSFPFDFTKPVKTFCLKIHISDRKNLVYQQNVCIDINGNRKRQTHIHSGRIRPHRIINILFQLGKFDNIVQSDINLFARKSKYGSIDIYILTSTHIRMKPSSQLDQTGNSSTHLNLSLIRIHNLCKQF